MGISRTNSLHTLHSQSIEGTELRKQLLACAVFKTKCSLAKPPVLSHEISQLNFKEKHFMLQQKPERHPSPPSVKSVTNQALPFIRTGEPPAQAAPQNLQLHPAPLL